MASTADLFDAHPDGVTVCELQLRRFGGLGAFHGRVSTVSCLEDNALVRAALGEPGEGRVLVVDGQGSLRTALLGDVLGALAVKNGWAGLVIHGAVRDADALAALPLGVKALGTTPRRSAKAGQGQRDVPVHFGGVTFTPGHRVYADEDGVLVSAHELASP